jgi:hypothetical protein
MAGQVIADMRWAVKGTWLDRKTWAAIGPGSKRGMNRFLGKPLNTPTSQDEFHKFLGNLMLLLRQPEHQITEIVDQLEAIDYQNCLCEFDKYTRVLFGEGRPKQRYKGIL